MPAMVTDNFTRANAATLGANWTDQIAGWSILSNQAVSSSQSHAVYTGAAWTGGADHYAEANASATLGNFGDVAGPTVRSATGALTAYMMVLVDTPGLQLNKYVASAVTALANVAGGVSGDLLRCEANGTTIRALLNGVQIAAVTDAAIASGKPGLFAFASAGPTQYAMTNFAADVVASTVNPSMFRWGHRPGPFAPGSGR